MRNLKMYILVNQDIEIGKGKLSGQVGHSVNVFIWNNRDSEIIKEYMEGEIKKIILYANQERLEELESMGYVAIRDKGYTELLPNTLTCVNLGIVDGDNIESELEWIKQLKLVK